MQHERGEARRDRDPRRASGPAPLNSTRKATSSSATYTASPTIPCSAATVTGIVWEAEIGVLRRSLCCGACTRFRTSPSRSPPAGRSANSSRPPEISVGAPAGGVAGRAARALQAEVQARRAPAARARPAIAEQRDRHVHRRAHVPAPRREHRQPEQQRGDARLREARHQPAEQPRQHAAPSSTSRRRRSTARRS